MYAIEIYLSKQRKLKKKRENTFFQALLQALSSQTKQCSNTLKTKFASIWNPTQPFNSDRWLDVNMLNLNEADILKYQSNTVLGVQQDCLV